MKISKKELFKSTLLIAAVSLLFACSGAKDTVVNRRLQNLSARYNYIFNANNLLKAYEFDFVAAKSETYEELLPVYILPDSNVAENDKSLKEIITKAQAIISEKNFSNYIDEAYMLLGKANYYQGNFFTSTEYFDYVARTYAANADANLQALTWKARSQYNLGNYKECTKTLSEIEKILPTIKRNKAAALATIAQFSIKQNNYSNAVSALKAALNQNPTSDERIRWNYILGQLQEIEKNYQESLAYYIKVVKSNAPFELYFNANLSTIKLRGLISGEKLNRQQQLSALLKDDKNEEYIDQIYFKIAESYAETGDLVKAEANYNKSLANGSKNLRQKGLNYLRLADLNFDALDYLKAKSYYDSALNVLPKNSAQYNQIAKKSLNLSYLSDRYQIIAFQDTAQILAKLPEVDRLARAEKLFAKANPITSTNTTNNYNSGSAFPNDVFNDQSTTGTFYFSNSAALSTGFNDFQRKWGSRPLQDNWRQSAKSNEQLSVQSQQAAQKLTDTTRMAETVAVDRDQQIKTYLENLPLTPAKLEASNKLIIDAYFELANFYQQELNDQQTAIKINELLLERFPNNNHLDAIFYSLYRSYEGVDVANSTRYKELVLKNYPNSSYAKTIKDPTYFMRANASEVAVQKAYNEVYGLYEKKQFPEVINAGKNIQTAYPDNLLAPQIAYLNAISIGRTNPVEPLLSALNGIVEQYPNDIIITPLVKEHIGYIQANLATFKNRKIALIDFDGAEPRFVASTPLPTNPTPSLKAAQLLPASPITATPKTVETNKEITTTNIPQGPVILSDGTFTNAPSNLYYFVVRVADASLTLSSSRFGIGNFNRGNFADLNYRHQLTELEDDQLIYVGDFPDFDAVKAYAEKINPQLKNIMKVPAPTFNSFIISKENFAKLDSRSRITQYITFFNNSY